MIEIPMYDDEGNQVGVGVCRLDQLKVGETVKFETMASPAQPYIVLLAGAGVATSYMANSGDGTVWDGVVITPSKAEPLKVIFESWFVWHSRGEGEVPVIEGEAPPPTYPFPEISKWIIITGIAVGIAIISVPVIAGVGGLAILSKRKR